MNPPKVPLLLQFPLAGFLVMLGSGGPAPAAPSDGVLDLGSQRYLLVDDHWLEPGHSAQFVQHAPEKRGVVRVGDEIWIYYTGYQNRHGRMLVPESKHIGRIARAVLRLDGFVSARGERVPATLTTKPLRVSGGRLILNYDAGAVGEVRAELCDEAGRPLPGFTFEECRPLYGNQVHGVVAWKGEPDLVAAAARPVRLRLSIRRADVYAFEFRH